MDAPDRQPRLRRALVLHLHPALGSGPRSCQVLVTLRRPTNRDVVRPHRTDFQVLAPGADVIYQSVMRKPRLRSGTVALALAFVVWACGGSTVTAPVTIKTLDPASQESCYLMGVAGDLVTDPTAGTAII